jgi:hypothetical protein
MATSKIQIIKRAASATGNGLIVSLDDNSDVAQIVEEHYDGLVESMLTQHAWKFARRTSPLQKLSQAVEPPWNALWQAPSGMLSLHYVADASGIRVDHEERDLDSGRAIAIQQAYDALTAVFTFRVSEDRFPGDFALALQYRLEAVMLSGIAEQRTEALKREAKAELVEQKARVRDQRASSATDAGEWDLTRARNRRSRWMTARSIIGA